MKYIPSKPAILLLEDGAIFYGKAAGSIGTATGELCFNTGMTGYQEIFTDPSYYGQLMIMTNAHIGNYGVRKNEVESNSMQISGLICKNFNKGFSRPSGEMDLDNYFKNHNKVVITDIDTRSVVRYIRDKGAMNAIISNSEMDISILKSKLSKVPSMKGLELSSKVTTKETYFFGNKDSKNKIAVLDLGVKKNILKCFSERDCYLKIFPMNSAFKDMQEWDPDGYFLSNGPGDPAAMPNVIETVREITASSLPVFGICLGHQALALSEGIRTYKMHNGHRGINHPVKNLKTGHCEVTSQNHGFGVSKEDIENNSNIEVTHVNLNDNTIEGIRILNKDCFSVQYHPESSPGPHDSRYLFDEFVNNIIKYKS
ncbi:MAG: glutamine-hydrolyzing carbamoyl-phosphate synthase small subunit [Bacteroidota bacterium]|nr:glutamine-hydrolyzing carbamoyl-phosphate synthase small subunit [Bacteroidota bacterium]